MANPIDDAAGSLHLPADDALLGRVIAGRFALRRCVGVGASGTVYQADQAPLGRTVAVKVLRQELAGDPRTVRRFNDEALAASRLNHPNVVSVIDYGQTEDGLLYLVMEYLRGVTLTHILRSEALAPTRIADLVIQILSALEEAHDRGVVHADLKADNIVVEQRRGDWELVKVVDFGIARLIGHTDESSDDRSICGTPEYMAPEVIRGDEPTFQSDLYAVGVVLYELLVGSTPFAGAETMEVLRRHLEDAVVAPSRAREGGSVHPLLEEVALRALSKLPSERFANATDFRLALASLTESQASSDDVLCSACGTTSAASFKFCPECGQPRAPRAEEREPAAVLPVDSDDTPTADLNAQALEEISAADSAPLPAAAVGGILPLPLIGRDAARDRLIAAMLGEPGTLHLVGPSGMGRTRLLRAASERAAQRDVVVYLASPDPTGLKAPFYPVRSIIAAILNLPPVSALEDIGRALEELGLSKRDLPGVSELFGLEGELWQLDAAVRRREILAATIRVLGAAGKQHHAVVAFEDFDRYDAPSQELLRRLSEANERAPSLRILISSRPDTELGWPGLETVVLEPLAGESLRGLAAHLATRGQPDLITVDELRNLCGGVPAHIHQLIRFAVEGGNVESAPESIPDLIAARLDLLSSEARRLLQAAAVAGLEITESDLEEILEGTLDEEQIRDALELCQARDLIRDDGGVLVFERSVIREVTYELIPADVRRHLHADVGEVLSASVADPALLGHHALLSGDLNRAVELLGRAGDNAVHQLDDLGACAHYNRALGAARALMLADDAPINRVRFVTLSIKLADALREGSESSLARGILDEAVSHCQDSPTLRAQLLRASGHLYIAEGDLDAGTAAFREAIGLAIPAGLPDLLCELYLDLATMQLRAGRPETAITELSEGLDLVTLGEGAAASAGPGKMWRLVLRLAQLTASTGRSREAIQFAEHAHRHANVADAPVGAARAQSLLAGLFEQVGDHVKAEVYRRKAIEVMRVLGDRRGTAELLLAGARPTRELSRITPASIREARLLAEEVGWTEGVRRAKRASAPPDDRGGDAL